MAATYASRLSPYENKGVLGLAERVDPPEQVKESAKKLAKLIKTSRHVVIHTGAGISTSAGIPDFRGPQGVWTLEKNGQPMPPSSTSFDASVPTFTHMAITMLVKAGFVKGVVSQNVDGLHLVSGLPRECLSELHGNVFTERCKNATCQKEYVRDFNVDSVGLRFTGRHCESCAGKLVDTVLDWEDALPQPDMNRAEQHASEADLSICIGTSLQIEPAASFALRPVRRRKNLKGEVAIVNLQPTNKDKFATLRVHALADDFMRLLCQELDMLPLPEPSFQRHIHLRFVQQWRVTAVGSRSPIVFLNLNLTGSVPNSPCSVVQDVVIQWPEVVTRLVTKPLTSMKTIAKTKSFQLNARFKQEPPQLFTINLCITTITGIQTTFTCNLQMDPSKPSIEMLLLPVSKLVTY